MKPTKKQIEEMILEIAGPVGLKLHSFLRGKDDVNEYEIAEALKIPIQALRNTIYQFEKHNLLSTNRKKDRKKGWYIYYLTLNEPEMEYSIGKLKREKLNKLKSILEKETSQEIYTCPNNCTRIGTEEALENQFLCKECGEVLQLENNQKRITNLKSSIEKLEEELKKLD